MSRTTKKLLIGSVDPDNLVPLEILLKNAQTRTLILWGDNDRVLHMSGAKVLESAMPNAKSVVMKNVGHVPMVEKPEESTYFKFRRSGYILSQALKFWVLAHYLNIFDIGITLRVDKLK